MPRGEASGPDALAGRTSKPMHVQSPAEAGSPRVTFGIIVLNGEPFTRYCLRSLYPYAHEIIVVEGAAPGAAGVARPDGHSADGTLDVLRDFMAAEDPEGKMTIVTAEDDGHDNGFWPGEKHEQSRAYARRASGNYLWQVDIDEFYREDDMRGVLDLLTADPSIDTMSFRILTFWGAPAYVADGWYLRRGANAYHRLFKWAPGYEYVTHRPPTVRDPAERDLRTLRWIDARQSAHEGILLFHYSLLFPQQVKEKGEYYKHAAVSRHRAREWDDWMQRSYLSLRRPFRVHNIYRYPSWLERYEGDHPEQIQRLMEDVDTGRIAVALRGTDDVERLLDSWWYPVATSGVKMADYVARAVRGIRHPRSALRRSLASRRKRVAP